MSKELHRWLITAVILVTCSLLLLLSQPKECQGLSISCIDGDTFAIHGTYFRLSEIDTPEKGEKNYYEARKFTCDYLKNAKPLVLTVEGLDKYNRTLVTVGDLNELLIKNCLATPFYGKASDSIVNLYNSHCK